MTEQKVKGRVGKNLIQKYWNTSEKITVYTKVIASAIFLNEKLNLSYIKKTYGSWKVRIVLGPYDSNWVIPITRDCAAIHQSLIAIPFKPAETLWKIQLRC